MAVTVIKGRAYPEPTNPKRYDRRGAEAIYGDSLTDMARVNALRAMGPSDAEVLRAMS